MRVRPSNPGVRAKPRRQGRRVARRVVFLPQAVPSPLRSWLAGEIGPVLEQLRAGPVLALLLLAIPILTLAYQFPPTHKIDVTERDTGLYLHGFLTEEQAGSIAFRWMGSEGAIVLPAAGNNAWDLTLRLGSQRPSGIASPALDIYADDRLVAHVQTVAEFRSYHVHIERPLLVPEELTIRLVTTTFDPPVEGDDRQLGVALAGATLAPVAHPSWRPILPPAGYPLLVLLLVGVIAGVLARLGVGRWPLAIVLLAALAGIALGQALHPEYAVPYLRALVVAALLLVAMLLALRPLTRSFFAAGRVPLAAREEQALLGIVLFGAALHLAGIVFPGFLPHDLGFHANRIEDILHGRFLLTAVTSEWGFRRTPYSPALYVLLAPIAALARDATWPLRYVMPLLEATSAILICYLLRRCRLPEPAPLLAAFFATLVPASHQLLWWGFASNLFGQWTTLVVLTLVIGHWADLPRRGFFAALVAFLALTLLSHPGTFVLTVALLPVLAVALWLVRRDQWRSAVALLGALAVSALVVYLLYYRFFTGMLVAQTRDMVAGVDPAVPGADAARGWEPSYIALRLFAFPFLLYAVVALVVGLRLAYARHLLGWMMLAMLATAAFFGGVHVVVGVWVRYFVFVSPALAIGAGVATAWCLRRGIAGKLVASVALIYGTTAALSFWFAITIAGSRSPYP
jgi:hypothetical protein